jgi:hypothetical protein
MRIAPLTLSQANEMISRWHRHHKPVQGHRFSIAALKDDGTPVGAAVVGRPVAMKTEQYSVAEVTRLVTDGTKNACSLLYGAAARICREMGFVKIQTFILDSEQGISLKAAGWEFDGITDSAPQKWHSREGRRFDQPSGPKQRWVKRLEVRHGG